MNARGLAAGLGLAVLLGAGGARADVWGFIDDKGVAHFASERFDPRYELFFQGSGSFDAPEAAAAPAELPRAVAVPTAPPKLLAFFEVSPAYKSVKHLLREAAALHEIDYELLQALIATESGFDTQAVSPRGAVGLMQVMPATAQRYGVKGDAKNPVERQLTDPRTNIAAGARYLRDLIRMFPGRLELALAAYNAGEGAVQRAGNRIPNYRETQNYVKTVMQLHAMLKPPPTLAAQRAGQRAADGLTRPPARAVGGAIGRGNMVPPLGPTALATPASTPPTP